MEGACIIQTETNDVKWRARSTGCCHGVRVRVLSAWIAREIAGKTCGSITPPHCQLRRTAGTRQFLSNYFNETDHKAIATQFIDYIFSLLSLEARTFSTEVTAQSWLGAQELLTCFQKGCLSHKIEFGRQFSYYYTLHYRSQQRRNSARYSRPLQARRP